MTDLQRFGERLAQLRREKAAHDRRDLEMKDVAKAVKTSLSNYSRYEAGLVKPRDEVLGRIADYFGVRRAWLIWGEGDRDAEATAAEDVVAGPAPPKRTSREAAKTTKRQTGSR